MFPSLNPIRSMLQCHVIIPIWVLFVPKFQEVVVHGLSGLAVFRHG
jgi:hypothetical protein